MSRQTFGKDATKSGILQLPICRCPCDHDVARVHLGEGINVVRGDGSGKWRSTREGNWVSILSTLTGGHQTSNNNEMLQIWDDFDE